VGGRLRRPPTSLDTTVARCHMYTYAAEVWALSIVQGPFSVVTIRNFSRRKGGRTLSAMPHGTI
jgi:hypothetical protein